MQDREQFQTFLNKKDWAKANEWIQNERRFLKSKLIRQRIAYHGFGLLMSAVVAFFTWVILFPSADKKELKAFPLAKLCHDLFGRLCETVPGGKYAVIGGLVLVPFVLCLILSILFCWVKSPKYPTDLRGGTRLSNVQEIQKNFQSLLNAYNKLDNGPVTVFLYFLFAGLLTGGVMVFSSAPGGLNPFEYLFVGIVCDVVYAGVFFVCATILHLFRKKVKYYPSYEWKKLIDAAIDKYENKSTDTYVPSRGVENTEYYKEKFNEYYAKYMGLDYETPQDRAKRIVSEVEDELSGKGYGDY